MHRQVSTEQDGPPWVREVDGDVSQFVIPFLKTEIVLSRHEQACCQGQHLNSMDVPQILTEPSGQMNLILEEYAGDVILRERGRMVGIVVLHEEVILQGMRRQDQGCGTHFCHLVITQRLPPHQQAIMKIHLFGRRLLILAIGVRLQATAPRVHVEEIKGSELREVRVLRAGIGHITDEHIHKVDELGVVLH